jgi:thiamine pyrophosphokinase
LSIRGLNTGNSNLKAHTAVIICSGSIEDYSFCKKYLDCAGLLICADGGAAHARRLGLIPDLLIGDFDSILADDLVFYKNSGVEIIKFPMEKDMSDCELAVNTAVERGYKNLVLLGALGTRIDHSLANILLLRKMLDKGINGIIANEHNEVILVKDRVVLERDVNARVSLLALSEKVVGLSVEGLCYPLHDDELNIGSSLGISNEFTADTAEITVRKGILLVIKAWD